MTHPEHKPRPRLPRGKPFAHFQWNHGWGNWEQVIPEAAGRRGVVAAYAHPPAESGADDGEAVGPSPLTEAPAELTLSRLLAERREMLEALKEVRDWDSLIDAMPYDLAMKVRDAILSASSEGKGE